MKVSELAKELHTTDDVVLSKLKSLKLKAKDGSQELNKAVTIVLRSELMKELKTTGTKAPEIKKEKKEDPAPVVEEKKIKEKKASPEKEAVAPKKIRRKSPVKKKVAEETKEEKKVVKKKTRTRVKKATPAKSVPEAEAKAKTSPEGPVKSKKAKEKISAEPFVPLKPLVKKKRKPTTKETQSSTLKSYKKSGGVSEKGDEDITQQDGSSSHEPRVEGDSSSSVVDDSSKNLETLELKIPISVKDFAVATQQKTGVVLKTLMQMGVFANINQHLGEDVVKKLAGEVGFQITKLKTQEQQLIERHQVEDDDPALLTNRAPVVTFMGHVDHGKTSLLDSIRRSRITDKEHGGITQHIGAYSVALSKGKITFLDTPGHEAFTAMRARGAHITDLVVLVVAADEGIMPQTQEAIDHARAAGVPIVVALNKIDRKNADVDRVKKQLAEHNLNPEDWGGDTIVVGVSAVTGEGVDSLLEMILLEAEMLELKANKEKSASGIVVEAHLSRGKGAVASLIVQAGTLKVNDIIVVGSYYGKIKAMFDDYEDPISEGGPSAPVEILGLPGVPEAGEKFYVIQEEKQAKEIALLRQQQLKNEKLNSAKKITLEDLYSQIQEGKIRELSVILKADVQGSLEAVKDSLEKIPSDEVKVKFIHAGVGDVNASDIILAHASNAIIIGFNVGSGPRVEEELQKHDVDVRLYRIIYDAVNDVRKALEGLLEPKRKKKFLSRIEVRQVFKLSKSGIVAGCQVLKGKVYRKSMVDVIRNGEVVYSGIISSLKRFKDDVREVNEGYECGVTLDNYDKIQAGDILEAFEVETIARTL